MNAHFASDWITLRGTAVLFPKIVQPAEEYLNSSSFSSAQICVEVAEITTCTFYLETASSMREVFTPIVTQAAVTLPNAPYAVTATKSADAPNTVQLGNLIRWKVDGASNATWSITFRYSINMKP
jgi:hypothetical protein